MRIKDVLSDGNDDDESPFPEKVGGSNGLKLNFHFHFRLGVNLKNKLSYLKKNMLISSIPYLWTIIYYWSVSLEVWGGGVRECFLEKEMFKCERSNE